MSDVRCPHCGELAERRLVRSVENLLRGLAVAILNIAALPLFLVVADLAEILTEVGNSIGFRRRCVDCRATFLDRTPVHR